MAFVDARELDENRVLETDICIVGSGPSGLAIAERFAGTRYRICILESGDRGFSSRSQRLSQGEIIGEPHEPLSICRVRRFGGSTGRRGWGGWCKPLNPEDFEARAHIPESGWPLGYDDLLPYYRRAYETCGFTRVELAQSHAWPETASGDVQREQCFLAPRMDFADAWADPPLRDCGNLQVCYNATVTQICTEESAEVVNALEFSDGRRRLRISARLIVLATGGIENARLLLLSDAVHSGGIGNRNDLVGRYFMEHPRIRWGHVTLASTASALVDLDPTALNHHGGRHIPAEIVMRQRNGLVLSRALREREELLSSRSWLEPISERGEGQGADAVRNMGFWLLKGRQPPHLLREMRKTALHPVDAASALVFYKGPRAHRMRTHSFRFNSIFEQEPQYDSRVTLSDRRDRLGLRRVALDWQISSLTERTFERTQAILAGYLRNLGHTVDFTPWARGNPSAPAVGSVRHHMGTTRMSDTPNRGVVDPDCRVYGTRNLYIAGTSVFPTGGNDMVTLTAIAISHRIADRLERQLGDGAVADIARPAGASRHQRPGDSLQKH